MTEPLYNPLKFILMAGPCVLESASMAHEVASTLRQIQDKHPELYIVFQSSFDKANRTRVHNYRGIGIEDGIKIFKEIKNTYHFPILSDIHLPDQAMPLAEVCDILQIPAFLCRQTDLLRAAAETHCVINVKKGQFLAPTDMQFVVEKLKYFKAREIWQTERGTSFGYGNLVVDMRSFPILKRNGCPVFYDATHSLQMPGLGKGHTEGDRQYAEPLAKAALAAGAQGLYLETHPNPDKALSDAGTQIPLASLPALVSNCLQLWQQLQAIN